MRREGTISTDSKVRRLALGALLWPLIAAPLLVTGPVLAQKADEAQPTGLVCNSGFPGNRGAWVEIDWYELYGTSITLGGLDAGFIKKAFPDLAPVATKSNLTTAELSMGPALDTCRIAASGAPLATCVADSASTAHAVLVYDRRPDQITVRRSISISNLQVAVAREGDQVILRASFDAKVQGRTFSHAYSTAVGSAERVTLGSGPASPVKGCAIVAHGPVSKRH
jgi:hypothetical protein